MKSGLPPVCPICPPLGCFGIFGDQLEALKHSAAVALVGLDSEDIPKGYAPLVWCWAGREPICGKISMNDRSCQGGL